MDAPQELLSMVCSSLTKADLKNVRFVSKAFGQAAGPFLFDEIYISPFVSNINVANLLASRFLTTIKTLTVSVVHFPKYSKAEFIEKGREHGEGRDLSKRKEHMQHAYILYHNLRKGYEWSLKGGEFLAQLRSILHRLPNAQKLILTDFTNFMIDDDNEEFRIERHDPWSLGDLCPFETCGLSESDHLSFHIRPHIPFLEDKLNF